METFANLADKAANRRERDVGRTIAVRLDVGHRGRSLLGHGAIVAARCPHSYPTRCGEGDDDGTDGLGIGGGVYNRGTFLRDAATVIRHNHASTSDDDCFGC